MKLKIHSMVAVSLLVCISNGAFSEEHGHAVATLKPAELAVELAQMPKGDLVRGKKLNVDMMCASCHGEEGRALTRNWPSTAAQRVEYTYKTLQDYAQGRFHKHNGAEAMAAIAGMLTLQDMADLAVYYASQALPASSSSTSLTPEQYQAVDRLARHGDASRLITPCASCHGVKGEGGINETPALAGQESYYFARTMQAYKQGTRETDTYSAMRFFASKLTDEEIKGLADYYAAIPNNKKAK